MLSMIATQSTLGGIGVELDDRGFAVVDGFLDAEQAIELRELYADARLFRSRIVMQSHGFGRGEYQYFARPLPPLVQQLRDSLYRALLPAANAWTRALGGTTLFPASHQEFLANCFAAGQERPTALLLKYGPGDYNCLHQDVYGAVSFPLQATIYLSRPGEEFDGGEVVLTEQRPRAQTRAHVLNPKQGDLLVLPTRVLPRHGRTGVYRANFKHGVNTVARGERYALGIVFADAQ
jgi:hypothetical protein